MPIYEYRCGKCKTEFELMQPFSKANDPASCPNCGGTGRRLLSVFASSDSSALKVSTAGAFRGKVEPAKPGSRARKKAKAR